MLTPIPHRVLDAEGGVLEQVGGLVVDLERILVVEQIEVEQLGHSEIVLHQIT